MTDHGPGSTASTDGLAAGELTQLTYTLETRFGPHLEAAQAAVREAERELAQARERLAEAETRAARAAYVSDPLTFMRQSVAEEADGLERKTTGKKVRASYRFLLDRAVELAAGEVQGFHDDEAAKLRELDGGVEACRAAEQRAVETLAAAHAMHDRVRAAEQAARHGLAVLAEKLDGDD